MRLARPLVIALLGSLFLHTAMARAQGKDPPVAEALFREGREAMKKKDYAGACPKFEESQRLDPSPGTLLNLAECEEPLGKLASAWQHLQEAIEVMTPDDKRIARAKEKKAALDKRVPRLTIKLAKGAPFGTRVKRDDVELGTASLGLALPVNVGDHILSVVSPGRRETQITVSVQEGISRAVEVSVGEEELVKPIAAHSPSGAFSSMPSASEMPLPSANAGTSGLKTAGYALGVTGLIGVGVGLTFTLLGISSLRHSNELCTQANGSSCKDSNEQNQHDALVRDTSRNQLIGGVGFAVGGALILGGLLLVLVSPPASNVQMRTWVSPLIIGENHVTGMTVGGGW